MSDDDGFEITFVSAEQFERLMQDDHAEPAPGLRKMAERYRDAYLTTTIGTTSSAGRQCNCQCRGNCR
jgi:hypothetical protein